MVIFTEQAKNQILSALQDQAEKVLLRLEARNAGMADFAYAMRLVGPEDKQADDVEFDGGGFDVLVDSESGKNLQGATVDYEEGAVQSGFRFDNPNRPEQVGFGSGERTDLDGPVADRVRQLLQTEINPAIAGHGGMIRLVDVRDNKVFVAFGGGCHGCGMVDVTLKHGVEARIKEAIPEIQEVVDVTDHARGENPYYR